ncbi:hypothetical protein ACYF6T_21345 [Streptomyces sp. 7R007]
MTEPTSHVEQQVQARIEAARRKAAEDKRRREELAAARTKGLGYRHARKLRALVERGFEVAPLFDSNSNATPAASGC